MTSIGFIGLGNMGGPMAANLAKALSAVRAFDLSPAAREKAGLAGCAPADTLPAAVAGADIVVSMLPADAHVESAYEVIRAHAAPGALFIDCSTISVDAARRVNTACTAAGFAMVDAPVSGGVAAATGAGLTFMVGGTEGAFTRAHDVLRHMGKAVIHAGGAGTGQATKICNNMLLGISMIGVCEAFLLAEKLGLETQTFFDIASKASGQCWSMTAYCPAPGPVPAAPSNHGYAPGFATAMMLKDLKLAQAAAASVGAATPLGAQAEALYALFAAHGGDVQDFSAMLPFLRGGGKI
jgi:3-hydroxyisobutyrate dehydrogenase